MIEGKQFFQSLKTKSVALGYDSRFMFNGNFLLPLTLLEKVTSFHQQHTCARFMFKIYTNEKTKKINIALCFQYSYLGSMQSPLCFYSTLILLF